ncbi:hypothetical protein RYX36_022049 [Vicia faba]
MYIHTIKTRSETMKVGRNGFAGEVSMTFALSQNLQVCTSLFTVFPVLLLFDFFFNPSGKDALILMKVVIEERRRRIYMDCDND